MQRRQLRSGRRIQRKSLFAGSSDAALRGVAVSLDKIGWPNSAWITRITWESQPPPCPWATSSAPNRSHKTDLTGGPGAFLNEAIRRSFGHDVAIARELASWSLVGHSGSPYSILWVA